jgi:hypothetical protein
MDGSGPVPVIVFAIATHMMLHPDSDLVDVLSGKKTLWEAQQSAEPDDDGPSISGSDVARS